MNLNRSYGFLLWPLWNGAFLYGFYLQTDKQKNQKWYIGSHFGCKDDGYFGSGVALIRALKKYGVEVFEREILLECNGSREELLDSEENILIQNKFYS